MASLTKAKNKSFGDMYTVPSAMIKEFSPAEIGELKQHFRAYDADGNGSIDANELRTVVNNLGENITRVKLMALINEVDLDGNHTIEFAEFLTLMLRIRSGSAKKSGLAKIVKKTASTYHVKGSGSNHHAQHAFSETEKRAFSEHINFCLGRDSQLQQLGHIPINIDSMDLFTAVRDGTVLCKLINAAVPDTIDDRALNYPKKRGKGLNIYEIKENQNLCINAATAIGCTTVNVHNTDIIEGKPHIVLGLIWQIVKVQLLAMINLKNCPELVRLLNEDEELSDLLKLPPDQILLRWFNFHLANSGSERRVHNFGKDLKDGECYTILLNQISPNKCDMSALDIADPEARAAKIISDARDKLEVPAFIQPSQLAGGDKRMNLAFCAQIFNTNPGLAEMTEEELNEFADMFDDDNSEDSREERVFRMWINSLGIDDLYVNNLYEDLRDGVVLLKVEDKVQPGIVSWRKVNLNPKNKFKKVANCNYAVVLGKQMKFSLVGIGGVDVLNGNKKLILAIVWQLMYRHTVNVLTAIGGGKKADDATIIAWANAAVAGAGKEDSTMRSFKDKTLANGLFLMDLLSTINAKSINWELVTAGETEEEREGNAKYVISVARKLGCCVFLTWEDITEVKPKMIMTFVASVMHHALGRGSGAGGASKN